MSINKKKRYHKKNKFYRNEQTKQLEKNLKDDERELQAIKDAFEKGNYEGLGKLPLKVDKFKRVSQGKVPKELSEKEKKKREEMNLKYVENLEKEQKRLFKDRAGRKNKIDPIKKIEITNYENAFLKECREVFSKDNKSNTNNKKNQNTEKNNIENINNNNNNKTQKQKLNNPSNSRLSSRKENRVKNNNDDSMRVTHEKIEIECDTDAQLDEQFLSDEDRDLYENQTGKVFELLKSIHLGRFIENFIIETYDNYDDFINLPKNFFKLLDEPFLNPAQQRKLFCKLHEIKKQSKEKKNEQQIGMIPATEIINNIKKNQIQQKKQNNNIQKQKKENKIFENTIIDTKNNNNNNKTNNKIEENNNEENEIKNHINELKKEEIDPDLLEIEELERKQAEEFKKAVEDFRNGNINKNQKVIIKSENGMTAKENDMIKTDVNQSEILCCWNCFKPIKKEETVFKNFNSKDDQNILFKKKSFCSMKCFKEFEVKKKSTIICFQCEKQFDIKNGFILYDRQKFCSTKCKEEYIKDNINSNGKNSNNESIKSKEIDNEKDDDISENDDYDPMNDF